MIYLFKLVSGEEIIADVQEVNSISGDYTISSPMAIAVTEKGIMMGPWCGLSNSQTFILRNNSCMIEPVVPVTDLSNRYAEVTGKIITPSPSIVLPK